MKYLLDDLISKFKKNQFIELVKIGKNSIHYYQKENLALKIFGSACFKIGKIDDAINYYLKSLTVDKTDYETFTNLGLCFFEKEEYSNAIENLQIAIKIKPENKLAYNILGIIYNKHHDIKKSIISFENALSLDNNYLDANYNLGLVYFDQGFYHDCENFFLKVFQINSEYKEIKIYLGVALRNIKKYDLALDLFNKILFKDPKNAICHYQIGKIYHDKKRYHEALIKFNTAIKYNSELEDFFNAKGLSLLEIDNYKEAAKIFKFIINKFPNSKFGYYNLGILLGRQGKTDEALKFFERAIDIDPNFADANYNKANCLLRKGAFKKGWEYYKWRQQGRFLEEKFSLKYPGVRLKSLNKIKNKTILLVCEQGLGDTIQFCRYAKMLLEKKANIIFLAPKSLKKILSSLDNNIKIIINLKNETYDFVCPLIDLPMLFKTTVKSIPYPEPYFSLNNNLVLQWKKNLLNDKFNIGIVWQGSNSEVDRGRSFKLDYFKDISKLKNLNLISLQKNYGIEQLKDFKNNYYIRDFSDKLDLHNDFMDTAALIKSLDLIITPCTSIAHLAGALGAKVWILLKIDSDWRWLEKNETTNWYNSMKIYRQSKINNWQEVFNNVFNDLKKLIN